MSFKVSPKEFYKIDSKLVGISCPICQYKIFTELPSEIANLQARIKELELENDLLRIKINESKL